MFLDHTQRRSTVGRTPLDEWSARRRDLYLTTHDTHNRLISMPPVVFEPTTSAGERPQAAHLLKIGFSRNSTQQKLRKKRTFTRHWMKYWLTSVVLHMSLEVDKKPNDQRHKTMTSGQRSVWLLKPVPVVDVWPASWYGWILLFLVGWARQCNELCHRRTLIQ